MKRLIFLVVIGLSLSSCDDNTAPKNVRLECTFLPAEEGQPPQTILGLWSQHAQVYPGGGESWGIGIALEIRNGAVCRIISKSDTGLK